MSKTNQDVLNLLGMASRARKIVTGETLIKSLPKKQICLVLLANDASDNTKKKVTDKCHYYQCDCLLFSDVDSLSHAIGKDNRVSIGICDKGFANKIKSMIGG